MARRTLSIDEKIEKAQEHVARTKERYDSALEELKLLLDKKDEQKKAELIAVIDECGMNYDEIIKLVRAKSK
ncbi:MAG TPA: hypothetical protein O0W87_01195 [Methanocorpusculum sp.]|jgi:hypothetical protein|nr:hypothetical protein [Methanocorpusculum sp.]